jgi:hypothetical protein
MHYSIRTVYDPFHLRITAAGNASGVRFQWIFTEVTNLIAGLERPAILLDERGSNMDLIDKWDMMIAVGFLQEKNDSLAHSKIAILANPGRDLDVATRFRDLTRHGVRAKVEAFDREDEALRWLRGSEGGWVMSILPFLLWAPLLNAAEVVMV